MTDASGPPLTPLQTISVLRWAGDIHARDLVDAIRSAAEVDLSTPWPELTSGEIDQMRRRCRKMTNSRYRAWTRHGEEQPTWLDVRALVTGLHHIDLP